MSKLTGLRKSEEGKTVQKRNSKYVCFPCLPTCSTAVYSWLFCVSLTPSPAPHPPMASKLLEEKDQFSFHFLSPWNDSESVPNKCVFNCWTQQKETHVEREHHRHLRTPKTPFRALVLFRNSLPLSLTDPDISEKDFTKLNSERIMVPPVSKPVSGR